LPYTLSEFARLQNAGENDGPSHKNNPVADAGHCQLRRQLGHEIPDGLEIDHIRLDHSPADLFISDRHHSSL